MTPTQLHSKVLDLFDSEVCRIIAERACQMVKSGAFHPDIAEHILTHCEDTGIGEFETALHCAAVISSLQPDETIAHELISEVYRIARTTQATEE